MIEKLLKIIKCFITRVKTRTVLCYVLICITLYAILTCSHQYYNSKFYSSDYDLWQNDNFSSVYEFNYNLISKCEHKCGGTEEEFDIVFLVKSYIKNYETRMAIRLTWGLEDPYPDCKVRRVFLMAIDHKNDSVRVETLKEQELFGDIILADYHDSYFNNSVKCMMGINWAREFCPNSKFYVLADDDAYISTRNLMKFLKNETYDAERKINSSLFLDQQNSSFKFYGGFVHETIPQRDGKWKVTQQEYPYEKYPKFLNGHCIVMTRSVLDDISEAANTSKFFKFDDVYLGFVAYRAGLECQSIPRVTNMKINIDVVHAFDDLISSHYITPTELTFIFTVQRQKGNA